MLKRSLMNLVLLFGVLFLVACEASATPTPVPSPTSTPIPTATPDIESTQTVVATLTQLPIGAHAAVGQTAIVEVSNIGSTKILGTTNPLANQKYIIMDVSIGTRTPSLSVGPQEFSIVGSDGVTFPAASGFGLESRFPAETLQAGATAAGKLSFLVPDSYITDKVVWQGPKETLTVKIGPTP